MGRRISKEFLHPSILEGVNNKIGNLDSLETDAKDNMVQAINELASKIDTEIAEGKELIANAVGEPLTAEESFDEMSNDINGLLSTFKTNMMNNGITVESGDKFKALIDKIATLADNEGKGVQFASGTFTIERNYSPSIYVDNLSFKPIIVYVQGYYTTYDSVVYAFHSELDGQKLALVSNSPNSCIDNSNYSELLDNGFDISQLYDFGDNEIYTWYAFGIGEEDTTLRDSLASILEEEGVSVTEEDDMASLISKVDGLLDTKSSNIDMISATELPLTGTDGQVCIITDEPKERLIAYSKYSDDIPLNSDISLFTSAMSNNILCSYNSDKLQLQFQLSCAIQNNKSLPIYYYQNGWKNFVLSPVYALTNGVYTEEAFTGHLVGCEYFNSYYKFSTGSDYPKFVSFDRLVNFDNYSTVSVTITHSTSYSTYVVAAAFDSPQDGTIVGFDAATYITDIEYLNNDDNTYTFDISTWSGYYYLTIGAGYDDETFYISNVILR